jgi:hypothetical protein
MLTAAEKEREINMPYLIGREDGRLKALDIKGRYDNISKSLMQPRAS